MNRQYFSIALAMLLTSVLPTFIRLLVIAEQACHCKASWSSHSKLSAHHLALCKQNGRTPLCCSGRPSWCGLEGEKEMRWRKLQQQEDLGQRNQGRDLNLNGGKMPACVLQIVPAAVQNSFQHPSHRCYACLQKSFLVYMAELQHVRSSKTE